MEGYPGQVIRSMSQVKGQGHEVKNVHWDVPLSSEGLVHGQGRNSGIRLVGIRCGVFSVGMWFFFVTYDHDMHMHSDKWWGGNHISRNPDTLKL